MQGSKAAETTLNISWVMDNELRKKRLDVADDSVDVLAPERAIKQLDIAA